MGTTSLPLFFFATRMINLCNHNNACQVTYGSFRRFLGTDDYDFLSMRIGDVKNFNMRKWRHKNIKIIKIEDEQTCKCFSLPAVSEHFWISPVSEGQILCWESTRLDMDNYSAKKFSSNNSYKYKAVTFLDKGDDFGTNLLLIIDSLISMDWTTKMKH